MENKPIADLRKSVSEWKAIPENLRSGENSKRIPAVFAVVGSVVLACVGVKFGVDIARSIDAQAAATQEGLNRPGCTTEVTDKQQTPEYISVRPYAPPTKVPASQTVTMVLGEGCRPGTPGSEVEIGVGDELWEKVQPGDMLYHPGGSADWDVYDNSAVPMDGSAGSKESNSTDDSGDDNIVRDLPTVGASRRANQASPAAIQGEYSAPAASEFYISPKCIADEV